MSTNGQLTGTGTLTNNITHWNTSLIKFYNWTINRSFNRHNQTDASQTQRAHNQRRKHDQKSSTHHEVPQINRSVKIPNRPFVVLHYANFPSNTKIYTPAIDITHQQQWKKSTTHCKINKNAVHKKDRLQLPSILALKYISFAIVCMWRHLLFILLNRNLKRKLQTFP